MLKSLSLINNDYQIVYSELINTFVLFNSKIMKCDKQLKHIWRRFSVSVKGFFHSLMLTKVNELCDLNLSIDRKQTQIKENKYMKKNHIVFSIRLLHQSVRMRMCSVLSIVIKNVTILKK